MTPFILLFVPVFHYRYVAAHSTGKHLCSMHQEEKGQDVYLYTHLYLCGESEYSKCKFLSGKREKPTVEASLLPFFFFPLLPPDF